MLHAPKTCAGWIPPFCPNRKCRHHKGIEPGFRWRKRGFFTRKSDRRRVQRLECGTCGVTFSTQTFSLSYWQKRPEIFYRLFFKVSGAMANRQAARELGCAPETATRQLARLGRHCLLFHMQHWQKSAPKGPICIDGFESFEYSQFHPIQHHLAVEADTGFVLYHTDSELRRKGRMTARQRRRRAQLEAQHGRPSGKAIQEDVQQLLDVVLAQATSAVVRSDDHRSYRPAIVAQSCAVQHQVVSSRRARNPQNPLFPINELDMLLRHSQSNHRRETIAFSKRRQGSADRLTVFQVWRNYVKRHREKGPPITPAMKRGLLSAPLKVKDICRERLFPERIGLPPRWQEYYDRVVETREIANNRRHTLKYAY